MTRECQEFSPPKVEASGPVRSDVDLGPGQGNPNYSSTRVSVWLARLIEFGFVQGLVQVLGAAAGLLLVRTLSKQDYALFAITNSMQVTANALADIGIAIGFRSLGGRVWESRTRMGQLVNAALGLRRQFATVSLLVTLPVAGWMLRRNGASWALTMGLCLALCAGLLPLLQSSVFTATLQLLAQYRRIQKLDLGNAGLRLVLIASLAATQINALCAILVGAFGNWVQMIFSKRWTRHQVDLQASPSSENRQVLVQLSLRSIPNTIFFCFQGQITLLILSWTGNSVGVADVTALGRVAVLFAIFSVTFANVVGPRFARCQDAGRLPRLYVLLIGGTALVLLPAVILTWLFPSPILWLLGEKYKGLNNECGWVITAACVAQFAGVMWNLNSSKAWIKFQAPLFIPFVLGAQLIASRFLNLRSFHDLLIFNLVTAVAPLPVYLLDALVGLRPSRRVRKE